MPALVDIVGPKWPTLSRRANIVKGNVDRPQITLFPSFSLVHITLFLSHSYPYHILSCFLSPTWNVDRTILGEGVMKRQQLTSDCAIPCLFVCSEIWPTCSKKRSNIRRDINSVSKRTMGMMNS